jgi:hypothetical protein
VFPAKVDTGVVNRWRDYLLTAPATRNGRPPLVADPKTGEKVPKSVEATTRRIRWVSCRQFFAWYARAVGAPNPFTASCAG